MNTIMIIQEYCFYVVGHVYEMPSIDAEALLMAGIAILI